MANTNKRKAKGAVICLESDTSLTWSRNHNGRSRQAPSIRVRWGVRRQWDWRRQGWERVSHLLRI